MVRLTSSLVPLTSQRLFKTLRGISIRLGGSLVVTIRSRSTHFADATTEEVETSTLNFPMKEMRVKIIVPVDVKFSVVGQVIVDDQRNLLNVDTTGPHVCRDKDSAEKRGKNTVFKADFLRESK